MSTSSISQPPRGTYDFPPHINLARFSTDSPNQLPPCDVRLPGGGVAHSRPREYSMESRNTPVFCSSYTLPERSSPDASIRRRKTSRDKKDEKEEEGNVHAVYKQRRITAPPPDVPPHKEIARGRSCIKNTQPVSSVTTYVADKTVAVTNVVVGTAKEEFSVARQMWRDAGPTPLRP